MFSIILKKQKYSFVCDTADNNKFRKYIHQSSNESIDRMVESIKQSLTLQQPLHDNFLNTYFMMSPFFLFRFTKFLSPSFFLKIFYSKKH